jgi:hypothetical protein
MSRNQNTVSGTAAMVMSVGFGMLGLFIGAAGVHFLGGLSATGDPGGTKVVAAADCPECPSSEAKSAQVNTADQQEYALLYPIEESLRVEGNLDSGAVKTTVRNQRFELRDCYQPELSKNPNLKGEMALQFTVSGQTGEVVAALERHTDFANKTVSSCILSKVKAWKFEKKFKGLGVAKFDVLMIPLGCKN